MSVTSFFHIKFPEDEEDAPKSKEITKYDLPDNKDFTEAYMVYSPLVKGIYIQYTHRNPLNKLQSSIVDKILDSSTTQLEIFNKFLKHFEKKVLNNITFQDYFKLEYFPANIMKNSETLYLGINPRYKKNAISTVLMVYMMAVNVRMLIRPKIDEKFFAQFFYNRTQPTIATANHAPPPPSQAQPDVDPILQSLLEPLPQAEPDIYADTVVVEEEQQAAAATTTKEEIIQEVINERKKKGLPPVIDDLEISPKSPVKRVKSTGIAQPSPAKRRRLSSMSSATTEEVDYDENDEDDESEDAENSDSEDEGMDKATELNLNNHFKESLQMNTYAKSEISSIGSSIINNFKGMHLNSSEFSLPLISYMNTKFDSPEARRNSLENIKTLFQAFVADNTGSSSAALEDQLEVTRRELLEQITNDNTKLQSITLQAKNGCVESIYFLFVIVLKTNIISN